MIKKGRAMGSLDDDGFELWWQLKFGIISGTAHILCMATKRCYSLIINATIGNT